MFPENASLDAGPESGPLDIGGSREAILQERMQPLQAIPLGPATVTANKMGFDRAGFPRAQSAVHMTLETPTIPKTSET